MMSNLTAPFFALDHSSLATSTSITPSLDSEDKLVKLEESYLSPSKWKEWHQPIELIELISNPDLRILLIIFLSLMIVSTVIGNILVCLSVILVRKLRHPSNYLLVGFERGCRC